MVRCAYLLIGNRGRSFSRWSTVEDCEEPYQPPVSGAEQPDTLRHSASVLVFFGWLVGAPVLIGFLLSYGTGVSLENFGAELRLPSVTLLSATGTNEDEPAGALSLGVFLEKRKGRK